MSVEKRALVLVLGLALWLSWLVMGQGAAVAQSPEPPTSPEATRALQLRQTTPSPPIDAPTATTLEDAAGASEESAAPTATGEVVTPEPTATSLLEGIVETRTPVPTVTPPGEPPPGSRS